jgi:hypothetical protein
MNFSSNIYGLVKNTTYYIRAYAYNELGVSYSNQIECITLNKPDPVLETVKIGFQFWTSRNLDVSTYRNGETIRHASTPPKNGRMQQVKEKELGVTMTMIQRMERCMASSIIGML